jgi:alpha-galactosidase
LTDEEKEKIKEQVAFYKAHRELLLKGTFYRILSPFEGNEASWIVVSEDKTEAIAGYYKVLNSANEGWRRFKLTGLDEDKKYIINNNSQRYYYGDELMNIGIVLENKKLCQNETDFSSAIYYIKCI